MRFITRIEQKGYKTYWLRMAAKTKHYIKKSFPDSKHGGKINALKAAQQFRDAQQKKLLKDYGISLPLTKEVNKNKGVTLAKKVRYSGTVCYCWCATFYDNKQKKQFKKTFSVQKYGTVRAKKLARQWRTLKLTGQLVEL